MYRSLLQYYRSLLPSCWSLLTLLHTYIPQLLRLGLQRGYFYDRMIIELSGVAEPKNIRAEFEAARCVGAWVRGWVGR